MIDILVILVVIGFVVFDARIRGRVMAMLGAAIGMTPPVSAFDDPVSFDDESETHDDSSMSHDDTSAPVDDATLDALARLVAAGVISASQACAVGLGITQRGNNPVYRAIRARAEAIKQGATEQERDTIVGLDAKGRVIRQAHDGRTYTIDPQTRDRVYVG